VLRKTQGGLKPLNLAPLKVCVPPPSAPKKGKAKNKQGCVSVTLWALPFTLKISILRRQKKNDENSNISPCKNIINLPRKIKTL